MKFDVLKLGKPQAEDGRLDVIHASTLHRLRFVGRDNDRDFFGHLEYDEVPLTDIGEGVFRATRPGYVPLYFECLPSRMGRLDVCSVTEDEGVAASLCRCHRDRQDYIADNLAQRGHPKSWHPMERVR